VLDVPQNQNRRERRWHGREGRVELLRFRRRRLRLVVFPPAGPPSFRILEVVWWRSRRALCGRIGRRYRFQHEAQQPPARARPWLLPLRTLERRTPGGAHCLTSDVGIASDETRKAVHRAVVLVDHPADCDLVRAPEHSLHRHDNGVHAPA
jgi:hypothetical protein